MDHPYVPIFQGVLELPPPVEGFHATYVGDTKVTFSWDLPAESFSVEDSTKGDYQTTFDSKVRSPGVTQFEVYYMELKNSSNSGYFAYDKNINVTNPKINRLTIAELRPNTLHQFFIVSR